MQIFGLHKNIYRLARYASTQELLDKQTLDKKRSLITGNCLNLNEFPIVILQK